MTHKLCEKCEHEKHRAIWPPGPWMDEPDRVEFEYAGLNCLLHRNGEMGNWCGYVGVRPGHPWYGKGYGDVDVEVHGGLTYAEKCGGAICHDLQEQDEPDELWWFGFDCWHYGDLSPGGFFRTRDSVYRDLEYVRRETERLAEQISGV